MKQFAVILKCTSVHYKDGKEVLDKDGHTRIYNDDVKVNEFDTMVDVQAYLDRMVSEYLNGEPGKRWMLVQRNSKRLTICDRYERPGTCFSGTKICTREWTIVKPI